MNEFKNDVVPTEPPGAAANMMMSRQAQEVQAAMVVAKRFPRDESVSFERILKMCARRGLAEQAEYTYPRGGQAVRGPSIRLAEAMAQGWGNIDYGILELDNKDGRSEMMAYAWDLETNTRVTKVFSVKHKRDTKKGSYELTDSRDIYEATANFGARRVRACIIGLLPGDVVDAAVKKCRETVAQNRKTPLADRAVKMLAAFSTDLGVSREQIAQYLGHEIDDITEDDLSQLLGVYHSLKDGMAKKADFFRPAPLANPFDAGDKETGKKTEKTRSTDTDKAKDAGVPAEPETEEQRTAREKKEAEELWNQ